jgi:Lipocalin-like domain
MKKLRMLTLAGTSALLVGLALNAGDTLAQQKTLKQ